MFTVLYPRFPVPRNDRRKTVYGRWDAGKNIVLQSLFSADCHSEQSEESHGQIRKNSRCMAVSETSDL